MRSSSPDRRRVGTITDTKTISRTPYFTLPNAKWPSELFPSTASNFSTKKQYALHILTTIALLALFVDDLQALALLVAIPILPGNRRFDPYGPSPRPLRNRKPSRRDHEIERQSSVKVGFAGLVTTNHTAITVGVHQRS